MKYKIYKLITREPQDWRLSRNGGDYRFGTRFAVSEDNRIVAGEHFTSAEFLYCAGCGRFYNSTWRSIAIHAACKFIFTLCENELIASVNDGRATLIQESGEIPLWLREVENECE